MAEKLSIQIALEGGEEIERQLEDIGTAGQKAFNDITKAAEQAGGFRNIKPEVVTAKLKELGVVGPEAFNKIQAAVASAGRLERIVGGVAALENGFHKLEGAIGKTASRLASSLGPLAGVARMLGPVGIAAGLLGASMIKGAFDAVNSINEINAAAIKLGVTIESLQGLTRAMEQAGLSTEAITSGFKKVQDDIDQLKLDRVKKNFEELQAAAAQGFSGAGSKALRELKEAAEQFTPAGKAAREALLALEVPIPGTTAKDVRELGIELAKLKGMGIDLKVDDTNVEQIEKITDALARMPDTAQRTQIAIQRFGQALGTELIRGLQAGGFELDKFKAKAAAMGQPLAQQAIEATKFDQSLNRLLATWRAFNSLTLSPAMRGIFDFLDNEIKLFQGHLIDLGRDLTQIGTIASLIWNEPAVALDHFINAIRDLVTTPIGNAWQWIVDTFNQAMNWVLEKARAVAAALKSLLTGSAEGAGSPISDMGGFAHGGHVGGRGTGMSDSNLAWVSRGEHIMPARAVAQPGVLAFLEALRRSGGNLRRVLDGMGRFAMGGPVAMPVLAGGGNGMSNVTIQFPGLPAIGGLRASADVVEELRKAAAMAQVRSGGRKPSRYS